MKTSELRDLAPDALKAKIKELEAGHFDARLSAYLGKLENVSSLRQQRRVIARAKTILGEKQAAKPA